jgi:hypothetical protein
MKELSVKEFAETKNFSEPQIRRVLEHPDHYPWNRYGIADAYKTGRAWKIIPLEKKVAVAAQGSEQLIDGIVDIVSQYQKAYPIGDVIHDLITRPVGEVAVNLLNRLPSPKLIGWQAVQIAKQAPPPAEVLLRLKPYFRG